MDVNVFVKLYDAQNHLIDILDSNEKLVEKSEMDLVLEVGRRYVPEYDHYKIEVQAHYTKYLHHRYNSTHRIKL